ncbi:hypothetical protein [Desulfovibrio sp.]
MTGYPYTGESLLARPCRYMYPPYGGTAFLAAWARDRRRCAEALSAVVVQAGPDPDLALPGACLAVLEPLAGEWVDRAAPVLRRCAAFAPASEAAPENAGNELRLEPLLRAALWRVARGAAGDAEAGLLRRLARKFEVAKLLHPVYGPDFRQGRGPTDDVGLYALLAAGLGLFARAGEDLVLLNALLKLCDLLCSETGPLSGRAEASALALLALRIEDWRVRRLFPEGAAWC